MCCQMLIRWINLHQHDTPSSLSLTLISLSYINIFFPILSLSFSNSFSFPQSLFLYIKYALFFLLSFSTSHKLTFSLAPLLSSLFSYKFSFPCSLFQIPLLIFYKDSLSFSFIFFLISPLLIFFFSNFSLFQFLSILISFYFNFFLFQIICLSIKVSLFLYFKLPLFLFLSRPFSLLPY